MKEQTAPKAPNEAAERIDDELLIRGGYLGWTSTSITVLNSLLTLSLILFSLPLGVIIAILVRTNSKGPLFYKSIRLGQDKKPFVMYKFRTLPDDARLLSFKHGMTTPFSRFIRDTRLDEFPQLYNVLKGDMNLIGPRPVRPEIYEEMCKHIPDYDRRFSVKPGLIGYSQVFTPHGAPKRIRALIDNRLVTRQRDFFSTLMILGFTPLVVVREILVKSYYVFFKGVRTKLLRSYRELRRLERIHPRGTVIYIQLTPHGRRERIAEGELIDINEEYFKFHTQVDLEGYRYYFKLVRRISRAFRKKHKTATCVGEIFRRIEDDRDGFYYIINYKPNSPLNGYLIDQYFLMKSLA